ncbi:hypothetical protein L218DRAFT_990909 [Marasmius fiardii PR-910]|nr:hypothetical protein L218DRAFT_990909 [Marasmius fiardii PR-910]
MTELVLNYAEQKSGIEVILSWIKTHRLETFTIFSTGPTRAPFVDFFTKPSLYSPLKPSSTSLRSLTIQQVEMLPVEFSAVLDLLPGLETLKFGVQEGISNEYLGLLHDSNSTSFSITPNLETLILLPTEDLKLQYNDEALANLHRWRDLDDWKYSAGQVGGSGGGAG